jgi:phage tail sheath protein FI
VLLPLAAYDAEGLLAVQRALIRLCAARADALAVLALPEHFTDRDVLDWGQALAGTPEFFDGPSLSYAAVYYPWALLPAEPLAGAAPQRPMPPDGAACGIIAARELTRGPWITPAGGALRGVTGLVGEPPAGALVELFEARVNLLRHEPGRFVALSAHTLSPDRLLVQVSVRRLLIFLRKLALRRGMRYVFESNNERFRRRVQAGFERTLAALAERGALSAFEVVTDEGLNTRHDIDNGRFLIALKVAPTDPVEFITVTVVRTSETLLDVVER